MPKFNLDNYELVEDRLKKFWKDYPNGRVDTTVVSSSADGTMVIVKAELYMEREDTTPVSSGFGMKSRIVAEVICKMYVPSSLYYSAIRSPSPLEFAQEPLYESV